MTNRSLEGLHRHDRHRHCPRSWLRPRRRRWLRWVAAIVGSCCCSRWLRRRLVRPAAAQPAGRRRRRWPPRPRSSFPRITAGSSSVRRPRHPRPASSSIRAARSSPPRMRARRRRSRRPAISWSSCRCPSTSRSWREQGGRGHRGVSRHRALGDRRPLTGWRDGRPVRASASPPSRGWRCGQRSPTGTCRPG